VAERPDSLSAIFSRGSGRESKELKVSSGSKRTPGSYLKPIKVKANSYWVAIPEVDRNPESV